MALLIYTWQGAGGFLVWDRGCGGPSYSTREDTLTFAGEAFDVEMLGLDPEHFPLAGVPAFVAVNDGLLGGVLGVLRVGH